LQAKLAAMLARRAVQRDIDGESDVHVLAELAEGRMHAKISALVEALTGSFSEHHAFLCRMHLERRPDHRQHPGAVRPH
jgi:trehalose-6-phosphatase